jgi:3-deoxy-D-manno-octulosonic-acid transferase
MIFYRIFIWLYPKAAYVLGYWNAKARLWHRGRQGIFSQLSAAFQHNQQPVVWMHSSSLGEFEQGLPVLEALRKDYPNHTFLLTFFSPSGYEVRKNYAGVDHVFYMPMDSPSHARRFYDIVQPSLVLFIKYEFWYYYLQEAKQRNIPLLLISGVFRKEQSFFAWYGGFQRRILTFFTYLFVQDENSAMLLQNIGLTKNVVVCGDTRFDRVIDIAKGFQPIYIIDHFCNKQPTLVAGSTWTEDDEALDHFANINPQLKFIIVPHEIEQERIAECLLLYKHSMLYSVYEKALASGTTIPAEIHVLIIDNMGMLSRLYHYADVCYVGGGFGGDGIHNILEATVYGKPVVFGPVYDKYIEATELLDKGAAFCAEDALELEELLADLFGQKDMREEAAGIAAEYILIKSGATQKVVGYIQENRLLTN